MDRSGPPFAEAARDLLVRRPASLDVAVFAFQIIFGAALFLYFMAERREHTPLVPVLSLLALPFFFLVSTIVGIVLPGRYGKGGQVFSRRHRMLTSAAPSPWSQRDSIRNLFPAFNRIVAGLATAAGGLWLAESLTTAFPFGWWRTVGWALFIAALVFALVVLFIPSRLDGAPSAAGHIWAWIGRRLPDFGEERPLDRLQRLRRLGISVTEWPPGEVSKLLSAAQADLTWDQLQLKYLVLFERGDREAAKRLLLPMLEAEPPCSLAASVRIVDVGWYALDLGDSQAARDVLSALGKRHMYSLPDYLALAMARLLVEEENWPAGLDALRWLKSNRQTGRRPPWMNAAVRDLEARAMAAFIAAKPARAESR